MLRPPIRLLGLLLVGTLLLGAVALSAPDDHAESSSPSDADLGRVELLRDRWGVPHVFATTDAGAFYGLGWASAEDRAFQMYLARRIMSGRLAELIGDQRWRDGKRGAVANDIKMRTFGFARAAEVVAANLDAETAALLAAYARGVNDYVHDHRDELHPLFEELGLEPEPWTAAACLLSFWHLGQYFATEGLHDSLVYRRLMNPDDDPRRGMTMPPPPPPEDGVVIRAGDVDDAFRARVAAFVARHPSVSTRRKPKAKDPEPRRRFSHAWVIGGSRTSTGSSVLVSDPQTPVRNPSLLYEFHLAGPTLNARGVGVAGSPIILIGWNARVAWGMTALGADQADQFRLVTDGEHPGAYRLDDEWLPIETRRETIAVRGAEARTITVRSTRWGPVVSAIAHGVRRGVDEVALRRVPLCETDRETVQGAIAMMRAGDADAFDAALAGWRFPSANVVFGDAGGSIGYRTVGAFPIRSPRSLDRGRASHDGSRSDAGWLGFLPPDVVPACRDPRRGWLASGNNRPIGAAYPIDIGIQTGSGGHTIRSWRLEELLEGACAGDDAKLTPADVLAMHHDRVNPARRDIVGIGNHVRMHAPEELSLETHFALAHLEGWVANGSRMDDAVDGTELAHLLSTFFRIVATPLAGKHGGGQSGLVRFLRTVTERIAKDPDARLEDDELDFIDDQLASAWEKAEQRWGAEAETWAAKARRDRARQRLGAFQNLTGFASLDRDLDVAVPALSVTDGGTIASQLAQSYTQWVPLHAVDEARSILPIGASERPGSPFRTATLPLWAKGELHPAPLSRKAVEAIVGEDHRRTIRGE